MKKFEQSQKQFKENEKNYLISCIWQIEHENFLLECWLLKAIHKGQEGRLIRIFQIWPDANGYCEWQVVH